MPFICREAREGGNFLRTHKWENIRERERMTGEKKYVRYAVLHSLPHLMRVCDPPARSLAFSWRCISFANSLQFTISFYIMMDG